MSFKIHAAMKKGQPNFFLFQNVWRQKKRINVFFFFLRLTQNPFREVNAARNEVFSKAVYSAFLCR